MANTASLKHAEDFLDFVNASPTPFHAVRSAKLRLEKAGFNQIKERDPWSSTLVPGGKYYLTRNASTIVAFAIGKKWKPGNPIAMVGAHTDSPVLRLKPVSKRQSDGFLQVGVETYGGGMWHSWFDRDLSIAGRVMCKTKDGVEQRLVKVDRPICRIPSLAVHFGQSVPFEFNKESQLVPIVGMVEAELNRQGKSEADVKKDKEAEDDDSEEAEFNPLKTTLERHQPHLVEIIASEAGVQPEEVLDFELVLYDTQKSCLGGLNNELIFSARLDNLMMTFCAVEGIIQSVSPSGKSLNDETTIRLISCFDHEEVGSQSAQGADSNMLPAVVRRLSCLPSSSEAESDASYDRANIDSLDVSTAFEQTLATSFLVSADMAHSVNPNYNSKYESEHKPVMNKGTVIKINANVRYATSSPGIVLLQEVAKRAKRSSGDMRKSGSGVPLQLFVVRQDCPCGSTIGPMLSASMGVRTLDLGNPQLSMHSIRETCGAYDVEHAINLFDSFFEHYGEMEAKILVD